VLSCYTGALACYRAAEFAGTEQWLAGSVRLAVRTDLPGEQLAFSHHRYPLDRLPDGTRLRYATGDRAEAVSALGRELARYGRALVVTDAARLPWSPSYRSTDSAPHWLLLGGRLGDDWQVTDPFSALVPAGAHHPHDGWLTTAALLDAMTLPQRWAREQHRRNELAFGFPVPVPAGSAPQWLRRDAGGGTPGELPGEWLHEDAVVLPFLADYVAGYVAAAGRHLDDLWTAARHRAFRHRWHGHPEVAAAWEALPGALRFAVDSARRGKPRTALVHTTFGRLRQLETEGAR
jgi:hypothetical protein